MAPLRRRADDIDNQQSMLIGTSARCGMASVTCKNKVLFFGGVQDADPQLDSSASVFFNDLYGYNVDTNAWFKMNLRHSNEALVCRLSFYQF